jgi:hypothetical protein
VKGGGVVCDGFQRRGNAGRPLKKPKKNNRYLCKVRICKIRNLPNRIIPKPNHPKPNGVNVKSFQHASARRRQLIKKLKAPLAPQQFRRVRVTQCVPDRGRIVARTGHGAAKKYAQPTLTAMPRKSFFKRYLINRPVDLGAAVITVWCFNLLVSTMDQSLLLLPQRMTNRKLARHPHSRVWRHLTLVVVFLTGVIGGELHLAEARCVLGRRAYCASLW